MKASRRPSLLRGRMRRAVVAFLVAVWLLSGWVSVGLVGTTDHTVVFLVIHRGQLVLRTMASTRKIGDLKVTLLDPLLLRDAPQWDWAPVWWGVDSSAVPVWRHAAIGLWVPIALSGLGATVLWWARRRRARAGHCACGYSLAGLGENAPCPECGRANGAREALA